MNFAIDSSTPSPGGSAPPESPVPAPRGTTGTPSAWQVLQDALHLLLGLGQRHHHRQLAVGGQPVALVGPRVLLLPQHGALGQEGAQRLRHLRAAGRVNRVYR